MKNKFSYSPINCSFYDVLEAHATKEDIVEIVLKKEDGGHILIEDKITNLETLNGEEFAILESGNRFRLDMILSINGISTGKV